MIFKDKKLINIITKSGTLNVVTNDNMVFNNALKINKAFIQNKLVLIDIKSQTITEKEFWFVCLNNARFEFGNALLPTRKECKIINNNKKFLEIENIEISDFMLNRLTSNGNIEKKDISICLPIFNDHKYFHHL